MKLQIIWCNPKEINEYIIIYLIYHIILPLKKPFKVPNGKKLYISFQLLKTKNDRFKKIR